jgi:hypothetical protein
MVLDVYAKETSGSTSAVPLGVFQICHSNKQTYSYEVPAYLKISSKVLTFWNALQNNFKADIIVVNRFDIYYSMSLTQALHMICFICFF